MKRSILVSMGVNGALLLFVALVSFPAIGSEVERSGARVEVLERGADDESAAGLSRAGLGPESAEASAAGGAAREKGVRVLLSGNVAGVVSPSG